MIDPARDFAEGCGEGGAEQETFDHPALAPAGRVEEQAKRWWFAVEEAKHAGPEALGHDQGEAERPRRSRASASAKSMRSTRRPARSAKRSAKASAAGCESRSTRPSRKASAAPAAAEDHSEEQGDHQRPGEGEEDRGLVAPPDEKILAGERGDARDALSRGRHGR